MTAAQNLDPYSIAIRVDRAAALVRSARPADAVPILEAAIQQAPNAAARHSRLYNALFLMGRTDEAFESFIRAQVLSGATDSGVETLRTLYQRGGFDAVRRNDLTHLLDVARTGQSRGYYSRVSIAATIAMHYALLGERDNALTWLEEAVRRRDDGPLTIGTMWYWDPFREDPRFKEIERQVGMPPRQDTF